MSDVRRDSRAEPPRPVNLASDQSEAQFAAVQQLRSKLSGASTYETVTESAIDQDLALQTIAASMQEVKAQTTSASRDCREVAMEVRSVQQLLSHRVFDSA